MTASTTYDFVRLSRIETQVGFPFEQRVDDVALTRRADGRTARAVLEDILREVLAAGTCYVTFSGGRDSSALLAIAVHVARRDGFPLPVPVTAIHPEAPKSDESQWQQLVLSHLQLHDQLIIEVRGQQRLLGESAIAALRRRGAVWPEAAQLQGPLFAGLDRRAALVSGEGGDNVITGGRAAAVRSALRTWPPRRRVLRGALRSLVGSRPQLFVPGWHTEEAAEIYRKHREPRERLRWDASTREFLELPMVQVLFANVRATIAEYGLHPVLPLVDPEFLAALAREGGPLGLGGRSLVFKHLVGDLLPRELIFRASKASFNETRWGEDEREFARHWDGAGLDPRWIDAEALRAEWLSDHPWPTCDFLLHVAWMAQHGTAPRAEDPLHRLGNATGPEPAR